VCCWQRNTPTQTPANDPNAAGNHRKSMMQAVEASLKRLRTDYIDLYWVHIWDAITPVEEVIAPKAPSETRRPLLPSNLYFMAILLFC
jgi:hypothetical protein